MVDITMLVDIYQPLAESIKKLRQRSYPHTTICIPKLGKWLLMLQLISLLEMVSERNVRYLIFHKDQDICSLEFKCKGFFLQFLFQHHGNIF